jgi:hypothetical protein
MKLALAAAGVLLLALVVPSEAQHGRYRERAIPNLNGQWFLNGDPNKPCQINQYPPGRRAEFINENGSRAWGRVSDDHVFIPDWTDGTSQGLEGRIRGDRIVWPTGTYWSR